MSSIQLSNLKGGWSKTKSVCFVQDLELKKGSITVLCGPNGAGKSTLLKTIARQIPPLSGELRIDGRDIRELSSKELSGILAYVPQFLESKRLLSVLDWVKLGRNPHQNWWSWSSSQHDCQMVEEALTKSACHSLKEKLLDELSGGERQRVQIAQALAQEPQYLLLDEPTAHLDFRHQLELIELLKNLRDEGLGIFLVLHDLNLSARLADMVVLMHKENGAESSTIKAAGSVAEVFNRGILRSVYQVEIEILESKDAGFSAYLATELSGESKTD